ncbi:hypothetical protein AAHA92_22419 [Salvia divinorum]|uniref:Uncharacterized protein n=1 Tax=Salvia divinorum TaxID=28513 RepID=A0ABD1GP59_SALDI
MGHVLASSPNLFSIVETTRTANPGKHISFIIFLTQQNSRADSARLLLPQLLILFPEAQLAALGLNSRSFLARIAVREARS